RVLGGAAAAQVPPSAYLLVVTFLLASFLGFGKRMHELRQGKAAHKQRSVLSGYNERVLFVLLYSTSVLTVVTYAVYTLDANTRRALGTEYLIATTPFAWFGLRRFLWLVREHPESESPTDQMLKDRPFLLNLLAWIFAVVLVLYLS